MPMIVDYTLSHDPFITDDIYKDMVKISSFEIDLEIFYLLESD